jgi:nitroreductase/FMN reductase [NAD(P)H]
VHQRNDFYGGIEMPARIAAATQRRFGAAVEPPAALAHPEALAALAGRSVCRRYRRDPLPEELVRTLCAAALSAPTKSDLQQATIVRLADPGKRRAITSLLPGSPWLAEAPELLVFCADGWRLRRLFQRREKNFPNEHLDAFFNATVDAALVLGAFVSAAELAGLGTCPISQIRDHVAAVDALLGLPDWVVPVAGLALGYPESKEPLSARLALSATVHTDGYDRAAVERELDAYDARRGRDWTGDKVRQYSAVMRADFGEWVRRKRFNLL